MLSQVKFLPFNNIASKINLWQDEDDLDKQSGKLQWTPTVGISVNLPKRTVDYKRVARRIKRFK